MSDDPIGDVVKRRIAASMDRMLMDAMLGATYTTSTTKQQEPLTLAKIEETVRSLGPPPPPKAGRIIESAEMVDRFEDWSKARSPSRTRRRMKYNAHRIYTYKPKSSAYQMPDGSLVMHPVMADLLRKSIKIT